jgi:hypothetical protein
VLLSYTCFGVVICVLDVLHDLVFNATLGDLVLKRGQPLVFHLLIGLLSFTWGRSVIEDSVRNLDLV